MNIRDAKKIEKEFLERGRNIQVGDFIRSNDNLIMGRVIYKGNLKLGRNLVPAYSIVTPSGKKEALFADTAVLISPKVRIEKKTKNKTKYCFPVCRNGKGRFIECKKMVSRDYKKRDEVSMQNICVSACRKKNGQFKKC